MKTYVQIIDGIELTFLLTEEEAKRRNVTEFKAAPVRENKASAKPQNKGGVITRAGAVGNS